MFINQSFTFAASGLIFRLHHRGLDSYIYYDDLYLSSKNLTSPWPFIWTNLKPHHTRMHCAKFGWNWPSGSWEEDVPSLVEIGPVVLEKKMWKVYWQTDGRTHDGQYVIRKNSLELSAIFNGAWLFCPVYMYIYSPSGFCPTSRYLTRSKSCKLDG